MAKGNPTMAPVKTVDFDMMFDAAPEAVWRAWTDPLLVAQWWGPNGVTIPQCAIDLRLGGKIYIVMQAGEEMGPYKGTLWPMQGEITALEPQSRLSFKAQAWTEGDKEATMIEQTTDLQLSKEQGKTRLKLTAAIYKTGPKAGMAVQGMQMGFTQQLQKLTNFLSGQMPQKKEPSMKHPVVHFEMPYENRDRVAQFYARAFGWEMNKLGEEMGNYITAGTAETDAQRMVKTPGTINGGFFPKQAEAQHPSVVIAVEDIKKMMAQVTAAGGKIIGEPAEIPGIGIYVSFQDSEGNRVSMLQPKRMEYSQQVQK